ERVINASSESRVVGRAALAVDLQPRGRAIPAISSDFVAPSLPAAVDEAIEHAALQPAPAAPQGSEMNKRRGISGFHCGFALQRASRTRHPQSAGRRSTSRRTQKKERER